MYENVEFKLPTSFTIVYTFLAPVVTTTLGISSLLEKNLFHPGFLVRKEFGHNLSVLLSILMTFRPLSFYIPNFPTTN